MLEIGNFKIDPPLKSIELPILTSGGEKRMFSFYEGGETNQANHSQREETGIPL